MSMKTWKGNKEHCTDDDDDDDDVCVCVCVCVCVIRGIDKITKNVFVSIKSRGLH